MTYEELLAENFHLRARIRELEQEIAGLRGYGSSLLCEPESPPYGSGAMQTERNREAEIQRRLDIFRGLFRGREDVFAQRFVSSKTGKSGYQPVCKKGHPGIQGPASSIPCFGRTACMWAAFPRQTQYTCGSIRAHGQRQSSRYSRQLADPADPFRNSSLKMHTSALQIIKSCSTIAGSVQGACSFQAIMDALSIIIRQSLFRY